MDGSVGTLLTIHYNLAAGTLAMFARGRPDVQRSLQRMLTFQTSCVSESPLRVISNFLTALQRTVLHD